MPETTLGVFTNVHVGLLGSMRSGLVPDVEVGSRLEPGHQQFFCGAG